jgi:selenocysteine-specific elongation factor
MTVVIGTAGHIDHGKTTLLRALTGMDADRLPEERARGLTIDVGYAHLDLPDGSSLDFVDVPGHDRFVGNMLVGAGEIDAALVVVAADDGPRAQTLEHLELLDALGIRDGIAVVTKVDSVPPERAAAVASQVSALLARTTLVGAPVLAASGATGAGIPALLQALIALRDRAVTRATARPAGPLRLAIDRAFGVKGRGVVVTGSLRGGSIAEGDRLRLEPGGASVRVRAIQVHNAARSVNEAGRTALNLAGADVADLQRGQVLTRGPGIAASDRLLVRLGPIAGLVRGSAARRFPPADGTRARLHIGTDQVDALVRRRGRDAIELPDGAITALVQLDAPIATFVGDRAVLRRPSPGEAVAAVEVLDPTPSRGISRRRATPERLLDLAAAIEAGDADAAADALLRLHGALSVGRIAAITGALRRSDSPMGPEPEAQRHGLVLATDVVAALESAALGLVKPSLPLGELRSALARALRRLVSVDRSGADAAGRAIDLVVDDLVARGRLVREGERVRDSASGPAISPELAAAMARLEAALDVPAPPGLAEATRAAGCSPEGVRALVESGRISRVEPDLAWATPTYDRLVRLALDLAVPGPVTPAALRDATGTSRRFVLAILEDLDRRQLLRRTPDGHVLGSRAPRTT